MPDTMLTEKAGGLPVWGWVGVAVAGVLVWRQLGKGKKKKPVSTNPTAQLGVAYPTGPSLGGVFLIPNSSGGSATPAPGTTPPPSTTPPPPSTTPAPPTERTGPPPWAPAWGWRRRTGRMADYTGGKTAPDPFT